MPELPEVETTRRGIIHYLQGSKIANIEVRQPRLRFPVDEKIHEFCAGQTILASGAARNIYCSSLSRGI